MNIKKEKKSDLRSYFVAILIGIFSFDALMGGFKAAAAVYGLIAAFMFFNTKLGIIEAQAEK